MPIPPGGGWRAGCDEVLHVAAQGTVRGSLPSRSRSRSALRLRLMASLLGGTAAFCCRFSWRGGVVLVATGSSLPWCCSLSKMRRFPPVSTTLCDGRPNVPPARTSGCPALCRSRISIGIALLDVVLTGRPVRARMVHGGWQWRGRKSVLPCGSGFCGRLGFWRPTSINAFFELRVLHELLLEFVPVHFLALPFRSR